MRAGRYWRRRIPEGFLRLGAYLAPKEMQLDVFMSSSSDAEIDAMIEVLREKVLEAQANPPMKLIEAKAEKVPRRCWMTRRRPRPRLHGLRRSRRSDLAENKLANFTAYKKQRDFFAAGKKHRERLLMAANRFGKTECGAAEMSYHLTGQYPPDWPGKRFDKPVRAWAAGVTSETTRDVVQAKLIGPPFTEAEWGQGMVPKSCIADIAPARGIPAAIDTVSIKHVSGGTSALQFKSFERGREKWQGAACEVIWFDEECPADIYSEGLTRTNETGGIVFITFTPLDGVTEVVRRFLHEKNPDRHVTQATIDDAPTSAPPTRNGSLRAISRTRPRRASRACPCSAPVASSRSRSRAFRSSRWPASPSTGHTLAAWTSATSIPPRRWSWRGTATPTWST